MSIILNIDSYKASHWQPVYKDPVTDVGKRSKAGVFSYAGLEPVFRDGKILRQQTLEEIRGF